MVIDTGDIDQRNEAFPPVLAALDLGEVNRVIELPKHPAKLNASRIFVGECGTCSGQSNEQQQLNDRAKDGQFPYRHGISQ